MRVLLTTEVFLPRISGLVTAVRNLAEALVNAGDSVTLACPESPESYQWGRQVGISLLPMPRVKIGADLALSVPRASTLRLSQMKQVDVVHVHSPGPVGCTAILAARRHGIPVLGSLHTLPSNLVAPFGASLNRFPRVEKAMTGLICKPLSHANAVIAPSQYGAQILEQRVAKKVNVVSNGVRLAAKGSPIRPRSLFLGEPLQVLYVGRLQREKRVGEVVRGVAAARTLGADVNLTIVGTGPAERELRKIVSALSLASHTQFAGRLSSSALATTRKEAAAFCIASRSELQCCAALEAMADGLPVFGARSGALPETAPDGRVGRLFAPGDTRSLGQMLYDLSSDAVAYRNYSAEAIAHAEDHSLERTTRKMRNLYEQVQSDGHTERGWLG